MTVFVNKNICWLDIAMYDALRVSKVKCFRDLLYQSERRTERQRAILATDELLQRLALDILHYEVWLWFFFSDVEHCDDSRMGEATGRLGFNHQTLPIFLLRCRV